MKDFQGKVAVVTGAASGIRRALAGKSAQEGMEGVTEANSTSPRPTEHTATKLDTLLVLAAVLAYTVGWGPMLGITGGYVYTGVGVVIIVAVSLLWLLGERIIPLKGHWVASDGWLRTLTKLDVLILLGALFLSTLHEILLLMAVVVWAYVSSLAWLRGRRASADDWFHRAAIFASFVAIMVAEEASKIWLYSGAVGISPSPLTHAGFHQVLDGSIEVSCVLLLLLLAWTSLRQGQSWAIAVLLVSGLPAATLAAWAAAIAIINQRDYGYLHVYAWLLTVLWVLSVLSAVRGLAFQRRASASIVEVGKEDGQER